MSNKRNRIGLYAFSILLMVATILTGCGRDAMSQEQANSAGATVETGCAEPDDSLGEESTGGQADSEGESTDDETLTEEEPILAEGRRIWLPRRRTRRNNRKST